LTKGKDLFVSRETDEARRLISEGLKELSLKVDEERLQTLVLYTLLIHRYNKKIRLCGYQTIEEIAKNLILDSLVFFQLGIDLPGKRVIDVGSGAGVPSVPLKIYTNDWFLDLVEPSRKKSAFLWKAQKELKIEKMRILTLKIEDLAGKGAGFYDLALTRAFGNFSFLLERLTPLLVRGGEVVFYQGEETSRRLKAALVENFISNFKLSRQQKLVFSFLSHPRFLTVLKKI